MFNNYLENVIAGKDLSIEEMEEAMSAIMEGEVTNSQLAGFLVALRIKEESIGEITGAAKVMRDKAISVDVNKNELIDTCGTGGDGSDSFNISTTVAFVLAGAGLTVAKHGNRSVSSKSGSADVLENLGVDLNLSPDEVEICLQEVGIGFLFAPVFHKAMKHAVKPRKDLGIRTIFNILGPLTNPAESEHQILGVYDPELIEPMVKTLRNLGVKKAMVVHGAGGLDEFSLKGENKVAYLNNGEIEDLCISPEDAGLSRANFAAIKGGTAQKNSEIMLSIFRGEDKGPKRDIVLFNAAAALKVAGKVNDLKEGVEYAKNIINSHKALNKLQQFIDYTNSVEVVS